MITFEEIDRVLAYLRDNAQPDAQARAERFYMEEWIKTAKAQEQAKHSGMSIAASEVQARISDGYVQALAAYKAAIFEDERRRFLRGAAEAKLEAYRTQEATRRAEGKGYQ